MVELESGERTESARVLRLRSLILWIAIPVFPLIVVLLSGNTRWIVIQQVESLTQPPVALGSLLHDLGVQHELAKPTDSDIASGRASEIAERSHGDYLIQLAYALESEPSRPRSEVLRTLVSRFPGQPGLYAHILRFSVQSEVSVRRVEEYEMSPKRTSTFNVSLPKPPSGERLAQFDRDALAAERLDPDNGYFPLVRAVGLFAAHRDRDAFHSLKLAGVKSEWNDYAEEEMRARLLLSDRVWGPRSVVTRISYPAATLFPHYARIRALARLAIALAARKEAAGNIVEGIGIRQSLMRVASDMRSQSTTSIGSLVAVALVGIAAAKPGGIPYVERPANVPVAQWSQKRIDAYAAFLNKHGFQREANWVRTEYQASREVRDIVQKGIDRSVMSGRGLAAPVLLWIGGAIVLSNALWVWIMGTMLALLAGAGASRRSLALVLLVGFGLLVAIAFSAARWSEALAALVTVMDNLTSDIARPGFQFPPTIARWGTVVLALVIPSLFLVLFLVAAGVRARIDSRRVAIFTMPLALLLFIGYAAAAFATAARESRLNGELEEIVDHEGRAFAKLAGRPWPGVTR